MQRERSYGCLTVMGALCFLLATTSATTAQQLTNPTAYRITYQVEISNISCEMDKLEVWIPNPTEWMCQRSITVEGASPNGSDTYSDAVHGNGIRHWVISDPPEPGGSVTLEEVFTYVAYDISYDIDPGTIGTYDPSGDLYQTYTVREDNIESAHPDIQSAAWSIVGSETNPYYKAQLIYDWVTNHLYYQDTPGFGGALQAYYDGYGECGDYAALFCALLRAVGMPARTVAGWIAETGDSHHVWAEFYLPSYGWIPTDPSSDDGNATWEYFGSLPASGRFVSSVGVNIELAADWTASLFQTFSWRWWGVSGERSKGCSITVEEIESGTQSVFRVDARGDLYADGTVYATTFTAHRQTLPSGYRSRRWSGPATSSNSTRAAPRRIACHATPVPPSLPGSSPPHRASSSALQVEPTARPCSPYRGSSLSRSRTKVDQSSLGIC